MGTKAREKRKAMIQAPKTLHRFLNADR